MSDLATVSAEIAPYLALAANSLGTSVITAAQQRIAERTVTAGEGFFRRLVRRGDGAGGGLGGATQPLLDAERADVLDELLAGLTDEERQLLSAAVAAWLRGPADRRDAPHLLDHVGRLASSAGGRTVYNTPTATGQGSIAAVEIHGDIHMGGSDRTRDSS
ncbi:hypothetical protein DY245_28940 [Streptomyces inhibens]|uniref:Uncharacterized protein n=1 Tax=Streptomyces inhibens TaxID=2293571 RepID=A0A371PX74_STRIH|nr:hypothetical protein [Streptomyces inhibens]REK87038.1 hypothetical protein DY245_28940 [Streptomyces inhibens]